MKYFWDSFFKMKTSPFIIAITTAVLLLMIPFNITNEVQAEGNEPNINFYVAKELFGHSDDVTAVEWSANGQGIASGSLDNTTRIWSTETWNTVKTFHHSAPISGISWSKNNLRLAISLKNGTVEVYSSMGWTLQKTLSDHLDAVWGLSFSPDGTMLSIGDGLGNIKIYDVTTWNSIKDLGLPGGVRELQWSNDQEKLVACSSNGTIAVWETATWTLEQSFDATLGDQSVESICWSPDDSKMASSSGQNEVIIWDTESWTSIHTLDTESNPKVLTWSFDDTYLAVGVVGEIIIWNTSSWDVIPHQDLNANSQIEALSVNPDGEYFASSSPKSTNNAVLIWAKNLSPVLDPIGNQEAIEDEPFFLTVNAIDVDALTFTDDSPLFEIDADSAQISFIPTNDDVGEHKVTITVEDGKGGLDNETFLLTVMNVDDPPVPVIKWRYGADYVDIILEIGGESGNSVSLVIEEDGRIIEEITVERESEYHDETIYHLDMNFTKSYGIMLDYSGTFGRNPVAITFHYNGFAFTKHYTFDAKEGNEQTELIQMSDIFKVMGLVLFDASSSLDVDNEIVNYIWDFQNGLIYHGKHIVYSFNENGNYIVSLTVESDNGINASLATEVILDSILDRDELKTILGDELVLEFLESIDYKAAYLDKKGQLNIMDTQGNMAGFMDGKYLLEIEGVQLAYSFDSAEIYYLPDDKEFVFSIAENDEPYELYLIIPESEINKVINVYGVNGGDNIELNEGNDGLTIHTTDFEKSYSLRFEAEDDFGMDVFLLTDIKITSEETHYYLINNWEDLLNDPKAITFGIDRDGDGQIDISLDMKNGMTGEEINIIILSKGKSDSSFFTTMNIILIVGFAGLAGLSGLIWATEVGKLALLSLILPLYTRIKKDEVLDNELRGMIRGYIIANPGDNYNSIKRALGLNNGALAHHLRVLERAEIIKSRQDGIFKRFYPATMKIPSKNGGEVSEIQKILLQKIKESPGISQKEIANLLTLSKGVINYHVKALFEKQLIKIEKRGRRTFCYLHENAFSLMKNNSYKKNMG